jgi:hypothetical protein
MNAAEMKVVIGDRFARHFTSKFSPFKIPHGKSSLWNSVAFLNDDTIVALTSTAAYSDDIAEVWMIKGKIVRLKDDGDNV